MTRVFIFNEMPAHNKKELAGGQGRAVSRFPVPAGERPAGSLFKAIGVHELEPGASIGYHRHKGDEEYYLIISGSGIYIDNDGKRWPVGPGDSALCLDGEAHGLENTGPGPLRFTGIIVGQERPLAERG